MYYTVWSEIPTESYTAILADPPWSYRDKALAGKRGAGCKYDLMTTASIQALPVGDLAYEDCVLFCWATMPLLQEALDCIRSWGFVYKTCAFTWVKRTKLSGVWAWGMGRWTRANAEVCLLATRGKPKRISASVHSVLDDPIGRHSAKPESARTRIVQLLGELPKIELFARQTTTGWDAFGNTPPTTTTGVGTMRDGVEIA